MQASARLVHRVDEPTSPLLLNDKHHFATQSQHTVQLLHVVALTGDTTMKQFKSFTYELLEELGEDHALGCKCCRFNKGIDLPVPRELSVKETSQAARAFSLCIFKDWTKLNAIIKRFEGTIQKRWL